MCKTGSTDHHTRLAPTIPGPLTQRVLSRFFGPGWLSQSLHKGAARSMDLMTNEPHYANLIERYLCTCGVRFYRQDHDGEYFFVVDAQPRRLNVHLKMSPSFGDVLTVRVTPACLFSVDQRPWLTQFADAWNRQGREVSAIVHGTSNPQRIGVLARRSQWIREGISFEEFATFADRTIAAAIALFEGLTPVVELPAKAQPLLRDAS
jgi:hypothetical protein